MLVEQNVETTDICDFQVIWDEEKNTCKRRRKWKFNNHSKTQKNYKERAERRIQWAGCNTIDPLYFILFSINRKKKSNIKKKAKIGKNLSEIEVDVGGCGGEERRGQ